VTPAPAMKIPQEARGAIVAPRLRIARVLYSTVLQCRDATDPSVPQRRQRMRLGARNEWRIRRKFAHETPLAPERSDIGDSRMRPTPSPASFCLT
jgi:hypothetical protein